MNLQAPFILIPWDCWFFLKSLSREGYIDHPGVKHTVVIPHEMSDDFQHLQTIESLNIKSIPSIDGRKLIKSELLQNKESIGSIESFAESLIRKQKASERSFRREFPQTQYWILGDRFSLLKLRKYFKAKKKAKEVEYINPKKIVTHSKIFELNIGEGDRRCSLVGIRYQNC